MRVSSSQMYESHRNNIAQRFTQYSQAQNELVTGKKINKLSDDPVQSGRLLKLKSLERNMAQYTSNLNSAKDYLGGSAVALDETQRLVQRAYSIALQGANSSTDQSAREALSREVGSMQERLLYLANSRGSSGQYLFAGQKNDSPAYSVSATGLVYNGDNNTIQIETGPNESLQINTLGGKSFIDAYNSLKSLKSNLDGGNPGSVSGLDVDQLRAQVSIFATLRGEAGATSKRVTEQEVYNNRRKDEFIAQGSEIEDVDIADAMTRLSQSQTAYQVALQTASSGFKMSLLDYL